MTQFQLRSFAEERRGPKHVFHVGSAPLEPQLRSEFCISFAKWMLEMSCVPARLVRAGPHFCSFEKDSAKLPVLAGDFGGTLMVYVSFQRYTICWLCKGLSVWGFWLWFWRQVERLAFRPTRWCSFPAVDRISVCNDFSNVSVKLVSIGNQKILLARSFLDVSSLSRTCSLDNLVGRCLWKQFKQRVLMSEKNVLMYHRWSLITQFCSKLCSFA